jgi:hypothetical protein
MKQITFLVVLFALTLNTNAQNSSAKKFNVRIKKSTNAVVEISAGTIQKIEALGFNFSPSYNYLSRNFSEQFDFNNDGFKDLICVFPKNPSIGSPLTVLLWDNNKKKFVENPNYYILGHGDHMFYYDTVDDFDGDGDLDVYFPMENYHGENGKQPPYYFNNDYYVPGNLLLNKGSGFERIYIDTTSIDYGNQRGYPTYSSASLIYYDEDNKKDLIVPSINWHPLNQGFLATRYSFSGTGEISRSFVFPWDKNIQYKGQVHSMMFKNYNNRIYAFVQPREDYPDGVNIQYYYTYPEVWIFDKSKNGEPPVLIKKIELKRNLSLMNQGSVLNHDTFYITDLNKDGNEEIVIGMYNLPYSNRHFSVNVFDHLGNEITDKWFANEDFIDRTGAAANGFDLLDLNGDGFDDILFRDHFNSSGGDIAMFLNTGNAFEHHTVNTGAQEGFNIAVDQDKNGKYEILKSVNVPNINNSVLGFDIEINSCVGIVSPTFNTSNYSFCAGDTLKLSVTNVNKGDTLKWFWGTKNDFTNVSSKGFTDATKLQVTKTDSLGCTIATDTIQLIKNPIPSTPSISRDTEGFLVSSLNGAIWYKDGVKTADTAQKIKPASNGYYTVTSSKNGCVSPLSETYYYLTTSLSPFEVGEFFSISPNPSKGDLYVNYKLRNANEIVISVIDVSGRIVISDKRIKSNTKINLTNLNKGSYWLMVKDKSGKLITTEKIVKD